MKWSKDIGSLPREKVRDPEPHPPMICAHELYVYVVEMSLTCIHKYLLSTAVRYIKINTFCSQSYDMLRETWTMKKEQEQKLFGAEIRMVRRTWGPH